MTKKCKTCKNKFDSGVWMFSQFIEGGVLLFCSDNCKNEYINMKIRKMGSSYLKYYEKTKSKKMWFYSKTGEEKNEK